MRWIILVLIFMVVMGCGFTPEKTESEVKLIAYCTSGQMDVSFTNSIGEFIIISNVTSPIFQYSYLGKIGNTAFISASNTQSTGYIDIQIMCDNVSVGRRINNICTNLILSIQ